MFTKKTQLLIVLIILGTTTYISGASVQQLDSFGMMPEITVTAPRYEYQDEAWLGMVEGVVVEAQRLSSSLSGAVSEDASQGMISTSFSSKDMEFESIHYKYPMHLLMLLTVTFVILSIVYLSCCAYRAAKEVEYDRSDH